MTYLRPARSYLFVNHQHLMQVNSSVQRSIAWRYKSRYATEFVEGALLGKGGFGAVYMATNRLV